MWTKDGVKSHVFNCFVCFFFLAKEKERQKPEETDRSSDGYGVRDSECESVGFRHDGGGALLPVHPQSLQPARHQSGRMVRSTAQLTTLGDSLMTTLVSLMALIDKSLVP